jgi:hypothetical protein
MKLLMSNSSSQKFIRPEESLTLRKVLSFRDLQHGWHYGEGGPIAMPVLGQALELYYMASKCNMETDAFPGVNGEVQICCYQDSETLEITIEEHDRITFVLEREGEEVEHIENLTLKQALEKITKHGQNQCGLLGLSIPNIMQSTREGSAAWHLGTRQMTAEYRLYPAHA